MPSSSVHGKKLIKEWFDKQTDIIRIVDVGCGKGTYPLLFEDRLKYYWIGIEIWKPYVKEFNLHTLYNYLWVGDVRKIYMPKGDCVILGDILEHLEKEEALKLLTNCIKRFPHVVISIPHGPRPQPVFKNKYEQHLSVWTFEELDELLPDSFKIRELDYNISIFIK